ncbi:3'(2'),5'-bisphosphate nucleotidase CysQ [Rhizobium sp. 18065]|uniref:3'(2'),5'-bisphosphate nucleotidase CysQ n=1 Tax=Rhizobium sp. 18065 TaxID=2681411 RepID=UPI00135A8AC2|nr:3'(2'),5'-bisphosphate nucleotidase CysQ [Rhizobium sp. 18065]
MADDAAIARIFEQAALGAGRIILDIYRAGPDIRLKGDSTPVTEADEAAESLILADLIAHLPHLPVVAEEAVAAGDVPATKGERFLLVDPLDGTREFIAGHDDFTVNIALVEQGVPTIGMVYAPALGIAYLGFGNRAEKLTIDEHFQVTARSAIRGRPTHPKACALVSRSHNSEATEAYIRDNGIPERRTVGSSLKFCLLAEGEADLYPRFGRTMEWDTAAGDAVLRAAGGITLTTDHQPLVYGKRNRIHETDFANPDFIAWASPPQRG